MRRILACTRRTVPDACPAAMERMDSKRLTAENFLLPDPLTGEFTGQDGDGRAHRLSAVDWAHEILAIALDGVVPVAARHRFELARGILLYGFFWYPLWVQGTVEALRGAELALEAACEGEHGPKRLSTAESRIEWLEKKGLLDVEEARMWESLVRVRDALAEAGETPILTPGRSLEVLETVAHVVNGLFTTEGATG
jgi:hypothetical protein